MLRSRFAILLVVLLFAVGGCDGESTAPPAPRPGGEPQLSIWDAQYEGGVEGFYFLPPMVPAPAYSGTFDGTRAPVAEICVLDAARTACTGTIIKTFNGGSGSEAITVNEETESYNAVWTRAALQLSTGNNPTFYRLVVREGSTVLGYADLWVVSKQQQLKSMPAGFVGVVRNGSFQIKFRIEGAGGGGNQAPVAADDSYETPANVMLTVAAPGVLFNDSDADGDALTAVLEDDVTSGTLALSADGSFSYTPDTGFSGADTFTYRASDGSASSSVATVYITVTAGGTLTAPGAVADGPAVDSEPGDAYHTGLNTPLSITAPGLLANDVLGVPQATLVSFGGGDLGGSVTTHPAGTTVNFGIGGSLTVNAGGSLSYTPATGFTGYFTFQYRIGNVAGSSDATVTLAVGQRAAATNDTYPHTLVGNIPINTATSSGFSVLANDVHAGATLALESASNGTVTLNLATGTFAFVPTTGYEGLAGFTYSLTNGFGKVTADVALTVSGMIWFIDNAAAAGVGTLASPFNSIAAFTAVNTGTGNNPAAGDNVFIHESATSYTGPLTLLNSQKVIGQDATSSLSALSGLTPPADSPPLPATNSGNATLVNITSAGNGITLAQNNAVHGLRVGNSTGTAIAGASVGTLAVSAVTVNTTGAALSLANGTPSAAFDGVSSSGGTSNVSLTGLGGTVGLGGGSLSGSSGVAFAVTDGNATISYAGAISNAANRVVSVNGRTGGVLTLSGTITDTGAGILVQNNTGGTIAFTGSSKSLTTGVGNALTLNANAGAAVNFTGGGLAITTTTGAGFTATGGGTVQVTGANNVIASGTGTALRVENTNIGASGLTFRSISHSGGANGIVLNNTGNVNGVQVTGSGAAGSGGSITNTTGADGTTAGNGIYLSGVTNVVLDRMILSGHSNHGVYGTGVSGFSLANSTVQGNGTNAGGSGEGGIYFLGLTGTSAISGATVNQHASGNGLWVYNTAGTLNLAVTGSTFSNSENDGILVEAHNSANVTVNVGTTNFSANKGDHVQVAPNNASVVSTTITGGTFSGGHPTALGQGITLRAGGPFSGTFTYDINGITINSSISYAINTGFGSTTGTGLVQGKIRNNTIGTGGVAFSGSAQASCILAETNGGGTGTHTVSITDNVLRRCYDTGIDLVGSRDGSNHLNATITGNNVAEIQDGGAGNSRFGLRLETGSSLATETGTVCFDASGNTLNATFDHEIRLRQRSGAAVRMPGYAGGPADDGAVQTYLAGRNTLGAGGTVLVTHTAASPFQNTSPAGSPCPTPP
jgi:hypothetical protein